jgi:uracil-DNA glycosylase family 4
VTTAEKKTKPVRRVTGRREIWPLDAPGMPEPGEALLEAAAVLGDTDSRVETIGKGKDRVVVRKYGKQLADVVRRCLYDYGNFNLPVQVSHNDTETMSVVSGHRWGANPQGGSPGPEPCEVMVIGKMMGESEIGRRRQYIGPSGQKLLETCNALGIEGLGKWYVTNVLKTTDPTRGKKSNLDSFAKQFLHLLHQELRLVRPKYVLCLGTDAIKALMGKDYSLKSIENTVLEYKFRVNRTADEPEEWHTCLVMACLNPSAVLQEPKQQRRFERTLHRFDMLRKGVRWDEGEKDLDHRVIDDEVSLLRLLKEIRAGRNNPNRIVAVDAEWQGQHPMNRGAYLRCVQLSWRHKAAAVIALTHPGGAPRFRRIVRDENGEPVTYVKNGKRRFLMTTKGGKKQALKLLQIGLRDRRIAGFFTVSDLEWLQYHGLDLRKQVDAPEDWRKCRTEGGLNVELMAHAADESDDFELNAQIQKWTSIPRYDLKLQKWLKKHKADRQKAGLISIDGYGDVPDDILYPYAALDADATRRLCMVHLKRLDADEFGQNCWEVFHADQRAVLPVLEINTGGMLVDRKRLDEMTALFLSKRDELRAKVKRAFKWEDVVDGEGNLLQPGVNLESAFEVREILFGEELNRKETEDGSVVRLRPKGAISLRAMPITTTGKRPQPWEEVIANGKVAESTPSTNKTALGIMLQEGKRLKCWSPKQQRYVYRDHFQTLRDFQDYRFLNQVLKTVLRPPKQDAATQEYQLDEDGNWVYERGLGSSICRDNYVRTYIAMVLETGRWSSSRPNLQNLGKRRDKDYKRILGDSYKYSIRSIMRADEGCVLIESDYIGAELFGMAILAQDETMMQHALRNQLPEDHPDHYDIHSNVAVLAFNLKCEPTKKGLQSIDKEVLRTIAKSVVFGIAYGRGAKAIAMAAREEGIEISVEDAQRVIDTIFEMYPKLRPFFAECRARAVSQYNDDGRLIGEPAPRFLVNSFMRRRRFPRTRDRKQLGDYEREAMNFPIQSLIADVVTRAIRNFYDYREKHGMKFRIALQIHDALLFSVPYDEVDRFVKEVLPACMRNVEIWPRSLDGKKLPHVKEPYRLGFDVDISENWGELLYPDWLKERGIPIEHAHWKFDRNLRGYVNEKKGGKYWKKGRWYEIPKQDQHTAA